MKINLGPPDRIVRLVVGATLVLMPFLSGLALFANPLWFWLSLIVGDVLIVTAVVQFCPIYAFLGFNSRGAQTND